MNITHYYYLFGFSQPQAVVLDSEDIELTKLFLKEGLNEPEITALLVQSGLLQSTARMTLKVAREGVKSKEQCNMEPYPFCHL